MGVTWYKQYITRGWGQKEGENVVTRPSNTSHDTRSMSISTSDAATAVERADFFVAERCKGGGGAAPSGAADAERDDAAVELASALGLRFPGVRVPPAGALIEKAGNLGRESAASVAVANSESFSPTHVRANQRPPAMPRISRCAGRQCRGLPLVRSSGVVSA